MARKTTIYPAMHRVILPDKTVLKLEELTPEEAGRYAKEVTHQSQLRMGLVIDKNYKTPAV